MDRIDSPTLQPGSTGAEDHTHQSIQTNRTLQAGYDFPYDASLEHDGKRSLSYIALEAFFLGLILGLSLMLGMLAGYHNYIIWRLFGFLGCLTIFHLLEFWTTARFNSTVVQASSFLLFTNGMAYNIAYMLAVLEILISTLLVPEYGQWMSSPTSRSIGFLLVLLGQGVRSLAMAHAGKSFNHTPQRVRKESHTLVTTGVYAYLRHPSYFGFFWWAIGTQLFVGNKFCVVGYVFVLWNFFHRRIIAEEKQLVRFFGKDYESFRRKTSTGIPFVR